MKFFIFKLLIILPKISKIFIFRIYNKFLFYLAGVKYGKNLRVYNHIYLNIYKGSNVTIGNNFTFTSGSAINSLCRNIKGCIYTAPNAILKIGENVGISSACLWCSQSIIIGNNVQIGGDCIIIDTDAHSLNYLDRRFLEKDQNNAKSCPIIIEDDVLIGTRSVILKGVKIGARSVIGAGSVVVHDIPANGIAAGNPCKIIRLLNQ